jgi:hypothetical protein
MSPELWRGLPYRWEVGMMSLILFRDHPCAKAEDHRSRHLVDSVNPDGSIYFRRLEWMGIDDHDPLPALDHGPTLGALLLQARGLAREAWESIVAESQPEPAREKAWKASEAFSVAWMFAGSKSAIDHEGVAGLLLAAFVAYRDWKAESGTMAP